MSVYSIIFQQGVNEITIAQALAVAREKLYKKIDDKCYMYLHWYIWGVPKVDLMDFDKYNEYNKRLMCSLFGIPVSMLDTPKTSV